jgi:lysophospholipase L1-like esterase
MSGYKKDKHRGLKGNVMLSVMTVLLGCAVIASAVLLFKKSPAAKPALAGVSHQSSSVASQPSDKPQIVSSQVSSSSSSSSSSPQSSPTASPRSLDNALFIGDSFTDGLTIYAGIDKKDVICDNSMSAYSAVNRSYTISGKKQKAADAAKAVSPDSIFILVGSNDIAQGYSATKFTDNYGELIDDLQSGCPNAKIYVQSIFPVTSAYENKNKSLTNEKIDDFNTALQSMCGEKGVQFVNVAASLKGADGVLPSDSSSDGMHIKKASYIKWLDYLKSGK